MTEVRQARIAFLGDISLNDRYRQLAREGVNPFAGVEKILSEHDFVVGNLEAMSLGGEGENLRKAPRLTTDPLTLGYLRNLHLGLATLGHNHVYDHLRDGYEETVEVLGKNGIAHVGAGMSRDRAETPHLAEIGGIRFAFLSYVSPDTDPMLPPDSGIHLNMLDETRVGEDIDRVRGESDYVILLLHWGGKVERGEFPHHTQPEQARRFLAAGADLIVGHHTHTLQPFEIVDGKHVFYSLGNFCFADIHSDGLFKEIDWGKGAESMILSVDFVQDRYSCRMIPIRNRDHHVILDDSFWGGYLRRVRLFPWIRRVRPLWVLYYLKYRYIDPVLFFFWGNNRSFFARLRHANFGKLIRFLRG